MSFRCRSLCLMLTAGCALATATAAYAQRGPGGGGPPGGGMSGGPGGGGMGRSGGMGGGPMGGANGGGDYGNERRGGMSPQSAGTVSSMRGGMRLGPPSRWWDDKHFAKDLKLSPDQQHRMDGIFEQNRPLLVKRYQELLQEQDRMESLTRGKALDENLMFSQIDRVAQALANLEKAKTHYLFQIRGEMDADQIAKLEEHEKTDR